MADKQQSQAGRAPRGREIHGEARSSRRSGPRRTDGLRGSWATLHGAKIRGGAGRCYGGWRGKGPTSHMVDTWRVQSTFEFNGLVCVLRASVWVCVWVCFFFVLA